MMPDVFAVTVAAISVVGGAVGRAPAAARRLPPGADNIRDLLVLDIAAVVTWALGIDPGGVSRGGGGPAIHGPSCARPTRVWPAPVR
jgi:hypothetical protein